MEMNTTLNIRKRATRLLIVDDSKFIVNRILEFLNDAEFEVIGTAHTGEEAVDIYKKKLPDIVTLDMFMPGISGTETMAKIFEYDPKAKIIIMSALGNTYKKLVDDALKNGAKKYVVKPVTKEKLVDAIRLVSAMNDY